jgi:hypothetical protein
VYLPAIVDYVPLEIVKTFQAFLDFCYLARRSEISSSTLGDLNTTLADFHRYREVFRQHHVRNTFSLPRQHSMVHYHSLIKLFGAPNGLCSSITESQHIQAVKEPWRRSNKFNALGQMLLTNQRLRKLEAARCIYETNFLLPKRTPTAQASSSSTADSNFDETGAVEGPRLLDHVKLASSRFIKSKGNSITHLQVFRSSQRIVQRSRATCTSNWATSVA